MGSTARGYRYMEPTDTLASVDDHIRNLADDVDAKLGRIERGTATLNIGATGTPVLQAVDFVTDFPAAPTVTVTLVDPSSNAPQNFAAGAASVGPAGFTLIGVRTAGAAASMKVGWVAIG